MALRALTATFLLTARAFADPLERRATIPHDEVVGFSEAAGALELQYKPYLYVAGGCVPYPAVDANGNTSGGLAPTGDPTGGCSSSPGQVYSRATSYGDEYAIMYSWYWPKDQPGIGGHRHDWESIVVWLSDHSTSASLLGLAVSAHGGYDTSTDPSLSGTGHPLIQYISYFPLNHQLDFTFTEGGQQPLISWESMPDAARQALEDTDFGDANVPFIDANFMNNLAEASL